MNTWTGANRAGHEHPRVPNFFELSGKRGKSGKLSIFSFRTTKGRGLAEKSATSCRRSLRVFGFQRAVSTQFMRAVFCGEVEVRLIGLLLSRSARREYKMSFLCQVGTTDFADFTDSITEGEEQGPTCIDASLKVSLL